MTDEAQARALLDDMQRLSGYLNKRRNKPISINGSIPVSKASLHLLKAIGAYPNERMSDIALRLGITKGAVSQLTSRLQAEGLLIKRPASGSSRDILLQLTDEGEALYRDSSLLDAEMENDLVDTLSQLRDEDVARLRALIARVSTRVAAVEIAPSQN